MVEGGGSRGDVVSEVFGEGTAPGWLMRGEGDSVEVVGEDIGSSVCHSIVSSFIGGDYKSS